MAKTKMVARVRFDDGSKVGGDGKSKDYEIGEEYVGDAVAALKAQGLICSESELKASKEVLDEKDRTIRALENKLADANKTIDALQKALDAKSKPGRKPKDADESEGENDSAE